MVGRLTAIGGATRGQVLALGEGSVRIGRAPECELVLASAEGSRHHASIRWDGSDYVLEDLQSKNGTFVNRERIESPVSLRPGDLVGLPGLELRFDRSDATATRLATAPPNARLRLDANTAEVFVGERAVRVTAKEFLALSALFARRGGLVTKEELAERVWPEYQGGVGDYNIEQLISRLRRKLEDDPAQPRFLLTHRGLGYRLVAE